MTNYVKAAAEILGHNEFSVEEKDGVRTVTLFAGGNPSSQQIADIDALWQTDAYQNPPKYPDADAAKAAMIQWVTDFTAMVTGPVPVDERLSWDAKEQAARAYVAETADSAQTAMIEDEAAITQEDPADLAAIIIARADTFRAVVSRVAGMRRKTIAAINAVTQPAEYETVLLAAKTEAVTLAAALGITVPGEG